MSDRRNEQRQKKAENRRPGCLGALFVALGTLASVFTLRRLSGDSGVPPAPESSRAGHELKDMQPRQVIFWLGLLVVAVTGLVVVITVFEAVMIGHLGSIAAVVGNPPGVQPPPAPQLETANGQVLDAIHQKEDQLLNNYTWIDQGAGTVRIPIDRAMDLTIQRGLPTRAQGGQGQAQGGQLTRPSGSSSGRMEERAP